MLSGILMSQSSLIINLDSDFLLGIKSESSHYSKIVKFIMAHNRLSFWWSTLTAIIWNLDIQVGVMSYDSYDLILDYFIWKFRLPAGETKFGRSTEWNEKASSKLEVLSMISNCNQPIMCQPNLRQTRLTNGCSSLFIFHWQKNSIWWNLKTRI